MTRGVTSSLAIEMQEAGIGELSDSCGGDQQRGQPRDGGQADDVGFSLNVDYLMAKD